jgi:transcription elongation factor Elf1
MNESPTCPACGCEELSICQPFGLRLFCRCRDCGLDFYAPLPDDHAALCGWNQEGEA